MTEKIKELEKQLAEEREKVQAELWETGYVKQTFKNGSIPTIIFRIPGGHIKVSESALFKSGQFTIDSFFKFEPSTKEEFDSMYAVFKANIESLIPETGKTMYEALVDSNIKLLNP